MLIIYSPLFANKKQKIAIKERTMKIKNCRRTSEMERKKEKNL